MSADLHINHHQLAARPGPTLFEYAEGCGVNVPTSCRKQGKCKECLLEVVEGMEFLTDRTSAEAHLKDRFRLACCTGLKADSGTIRCHTLRRGEMRIERHAFHLPARQPDFKPDPPVVREGERVFIDGREVGRTQGPIHGLAMDLGTTTVVLRLLNLETGEVVADASFENPQRFGGSDVMARIQYDSEDGSHLLRRTLAGYMARAVQDFPVDSNSIYELVVVGNATMRDLFFGLDVRSIGQNPFQSVTELAVQAGQCEGTALCETARRLRLPLHPNARVYGLPIISGHVGADAAACMLAVNLGREERLVAIMDIGTNTELILGNKDRILAASCPAGPAFEGGRITCGMPGLPGAIERVRMRSGGGFDLRVIGDGVPEGICGSGLVDLLGELIKHQQINILGRFTNGDKSRVIFDSEEDRVVFTQADVIELAQAKAAHAAGLQIVFDEYGKTFEDLAVFYIAGGFGRHLNLEASQEIGLIPCVSPRKIVQVGNAAIEGACIALLSQSRRLELEALVRRVVHCRLETHPRFFDFFVEGCQFRPITRDQRGLSSGGVGETGRSR